MFFGQRAEPGREEERAEPVGRADAHRAGEPRRAAGNLRLSAANLRFDGFGHAGGAAAGVGQLVAGLAPGKELGAEVALQPVDAADDGGVVDAEFFRGGRHGAVAGHREAELQIVPVERHKRLLFAHGRMRAPYSAKVSVAAQIHCAFLPGFVRAPPGL